MTELEKKEIKWLKEYSDGRKELRRKSQEHGSLPDYANFDLVFWKEIYREGKEAGAKEKEELENEKHELLGIIQDKDKAIQILTKENAEFKETVVKMNNVITETFSNLANAKEIMQKLIANAPDTYSGTNIELQQKKMFSFQDAVNKAEQFLKE